LSDSIYLLASSRRAKVAVGYDPDIPSAERVVNSALFAKREGYAEPVLISSKLKRTAGEDVLGSELPVIVDEVPETTLVGLLKDGAVDAAVRGNLGSRGVIPLLRSQFSIGNLCRITILETGGRLVMLAPVGIEEGDSREDLLAVVGNGRRLAQALGIPLNVAVISGGRLEDRGRSPRVDRMLDEAESLTSELRGTRIRAENYGIELEKALDGDATLILAPDGVTGNLIFRSLVLVANIESYGAFAAALPRSYVDTSRAKGSFLLPIILASALSRWAEPHGPS
jgi:predicted methyltransferase MtxX (methanogen marker protein 4)